LRYAIFSLILAIVSWIIFFIYDNYYF
jgi:hypothetical protein